MADDDQPVLLVEDDPIQARLMYEVIRRFCGDHYPVRRCGTLHQALDVLTEEPVTAVLLDLNLPDSQGLETLEAVYDQSPELAIIILTGTDNDLLASESLQKGAQDYLVKGRVEPQVLARTIKHAIERKKSQTEVKKLQVMLQQERRLESLGAIASGIAHEINTPLQFIGTNVEFIKRVFENIEGVIMLADDVPRYGKLSAESIRKIRVLVRSLTAPRAIRLRSEVPQALEETVDGIHRVKKIITAMNVFSRRAGPKKIAYDVNQAVRDALIITRHEWKHVAKTEIYLDENLPKVPCYPEELSHCLLNLIVNAVHAIQDARKADDGRSDGRQDVISISTQLDGDRVEIRVGDSGCGIPEEIRHRVFEPFFTTKEVGRGSGQGLSTAHHMIVRHLGGTFSFETKAGQGTVFKIGIPLRDGDSERPPDIPEVGERQ